MSYSMLVTDDLNELKTDWSHLFDADLNSYCQDFSFMKGIDLFTQKNIFSRLYFHKLFYYVVKKNEEIVLIAPLYVSKRTACLAGMNASINYMGFIHGKNLQESDVIFLFDYLKLKKITNLKTGFILNTDSVIYGIINSLHSKYEITSHESVNVQLNNNFSSFENYFNSLSKSTRQNYRTSLNRIRKDGRQYSITYFGGSNIETQIPSEIILEFLKMHRNRIDSKYMDKNRSKILSCILRPIRRMIYGKQLKDTVAYCCMKEKNHQLLAMLSIDDTPAAFFYGLIQKTRISFLRVCVDEKNFGFYSPGMILGIETIKHFFSEFTVFDFTCGTESYKYKLGCENNYGKSFVISF